MSKPTLSLVIPAYNEEENLRRILPEIGAACAAEGWTLIVVDDGSTDRTAAAVDEYRAAVGKRAGDRADDRVGGPPIVFLRHKVNRGYGGALKTGLRAATTDYALTLDADGQHDIGEAAKMLAEIVSADADLVVGPTLLARREPVSAGGQRPDPFHGQAPASPPGQRPELGF